MLIINIGFVFLTGVAFSRGIRLFIKWKQSRHRKSLQSWLSWHNLPRKLDSVQYPWPVGKTAFSSSHSYPAGLERSWYFSVIFSSQLSWGFLVLISDQIATYISFPQIYHIWFSEDIKKKIPNCIWTQYLIFVLLLLMLFVCYFCFF